MSLYLLSYLFIGALIMAIAMLRTPYSSEPDAMVNAAAGGVSIFDKMLAAFIAPLFACLFAVLTWPLVLIWKVQEMRDTKERLAMRGDSPQPKSVQSGRAQIHARINGKIVTTEEYDLVMQNGGVFPASVLEAIERRTFRTTKERRQIEKAKKLAGKSPGQLEPK